MILELIEKRTGVKAHALLKYSESASKRYRVYYIQKRHGGLRQIAHPAKPLKSLQRLTARLIIDPKKIHASASAYRAGKNIRDNALAHAKHPFTVRIDFVDFFHRFEAAHLERYIEEVLGQQYELSEDDKKFIVNISCRNGALTIGAPISPPLTNLMMRDFDESIYLYCQKNQLIYTRYADDIFISATAPGVLQDAANAVEHAAKEYKYSNLEINSDKTVFMSRRYRRVVTGLVITPTGDISIGRSKKREIRTLVYLALNGGLGEDQRPYLSGWLAYIHSCDRPYFDALLTKFGEGVKALMA